MQPSLVSLGEIMVEEIVSEPEVNTTSVVHQSDRSLGGAAINLCWHWAMLGIPSRLMGLATPRDRQLLIDTIPRLVDVSVIETIGVDTDRLVTFLAGPSHKSAYFMGDVEQEQVEKLASQVSAQATLVLNGGRHREFRAAYVDICGRLGGPSLIFNPSYAVYEYGHSELEAVISSVSLTAVNLDEAEYVVETLGVPSIEELANECSGRVLVTAGGQGGALHGDGPPIKWPGSSTSASLCVGAGDAFLAGFLASRSNDPSKRVAWGASVAAVVVKTGEVRPTYSIDLVQQETVPRA